MGALFVLAERNSSLDCEQQRKLPETDPFDRQIIIGLNAFVELLAMVAAQDGFRVEIDLFPEGEP